MFRVSDTGGRVCLRPRQNSRTSRLHPGLRHRPTWSPTSPGTTASRARPRFTPDPRCSGSTTRGKELHHLVIVRLDEGRTYDSLLAALRKPGPPPAWMYLAGGPNAAAPNAGTNATMKLIEGHYAVLCFIPSADGVPHMAKGMIAPLEVDGRLRAAGPRDRGRHHNQAYRLRLRAVLAAHTGQSCHPGRERGAATA